MVKLGFIVEGDTEKIILESSDFFDILRSHSIPFHPNVINAASNTKLLPDKIVEFTKVLEDQGVTHILVLTDMDKDKCITKTKERISPLQNHHVVVSVKTIEAWYLSDTEALRKYFGDSNFYFEDPEAVENPFEEIKSIRLSKLNKGVSDKKLLAKRMIQSGFSLVKASQHPNNQSTKYLLNLLTRFQPSTPPSNFELIP